MHRERAQRAGHLVRDLLRVSCPPEAEADGRQTLTDDPGVGGGLWRRREVQLDADIGEAWHTEIHPTYPNVWPQTDSGLPWPRLSPQMAF